MIQASIHQSRVSPHVRSPRRHRRPFTLLTGASSLSWYGFLKTSFVFHADRAAIRCCFTSSLDTRRVDRSIRVVVRVVRRQGSTRPPRPSLHSIGNGDSYHASALASHVGHLFRWAPGTRSALTVQGLTRPVRERRSQGEGRTPRTVSTRPTPRSAAPGLLTQTPPTRCAFR